VEEKIGQQRNQKWRQNRNEDEVQIDTFKRQTRTTKWRKQKCNEHYKSNCEQMNRRKSYQLRMEESRSEPGYTWAELGKRLI
jgi:hypothetical protein